MWRHETQHSDTQHNDAQHYATQHNAAQHYDTQHNNKNTAFSVMALGTQYCYPECHLN